MSWAESASTDVHPLVRLRLWDGSCCVCLTLLLCWLHCSRGGGAYYERYSSDIDKYTSVMELDNGIWDTNGAATPLHLATSSPLIGPLRIHLSASHSSNSLVLPVITCLELFGKRGSIYGLYKIYILTGELQTHCTYPPL